MAVTQSESDAVLAPLLIHGKEIGRMAGDGDPTSLEIMKWYRMWKQCPGDAMSCSMVEKFTRDWLNERSET